MADISQRVLDMVRRELVQDPTVENADLFEKALKLDPSAMKDVDRRQFNARYPLRVKRFEMKARKPREAGEPKPERRPAKKATPTNGEPAPVIRRMARDGVRDIFLRFAQDLANADSRGEIVTVVAGVDRYVEQVIDLGPLSKS